MKQIEIGPDGVDPLPEIVDVERDRDLADGERELAVLDPEAGGAAEKSPVTALKPKPIISVT
jgi:hypothetical protein